MSASLDGRALMRVDPRRIAEVRVDARDPECTKVYLVTEEVGRPNTDVWYRKTLPSGVPALETAAAAIQTGEFAISWERVPDPDRELVC